VEKGWKEYTISGAASFFGDMEERKEGRGDEVKSARAAEEMRRGHFVNGPFEYQPPYARYHGRKRVNILLETGPKREAR